MERVLIFENLTHLASQLVGLDLKDNPNLRDMEEGVSMDPILPHVPITSPITRPASPGSPFLKKTDLKIKRDIQSEWSGAGDVVVCTRA